MCGVAHCLCDEALAFELVGNWKFYNRENEIEVKLQFEFFHAQIIRMASTSTVPASVILKRQLAALVLTVERALENAVENIHRNMSNYF